MRSLYLLLLASIALADVDIKKPESGQTFDASGGSAIIEIEWEDDTVSFDFSDLDNAEHYDITLMTGTNDNIGTVKRMGSKLDNTERSFTAKIDNDVGPNGYYFFQIYTQFPYQGYTIHYTNRFRLTGMDGSGSSFTFENALFSESGHQPQPQWNAGGTALKIDSDSFTLTYTAQTGWVRHETSSFTPYTAISHFPNAWTTTTAPKTYTIDSKVNSAPINTYPTYYYPASSRIRSATLSNARRKRWV
ncbi:cell wall synthesis protein knh1 [Candidozyma auris]